MERPTRAIVLLAGLNGLLAVAAGAFAAHGVHDPGVRDLLRTGSQYQLAHAVAALACLGWSPGAGPTRVAGWLFGLGGLLFGGSLYLLAATRLGALGAITPLGGLLLLAGWSCVIAAALRRA